MTTYITITDPETDPDAPLTSELAKKWRDNAIAIAEGDSTAPVNQGNWHPYNKVTNGDSNDGKFYDFAIDGAVANRVTPDFVDGYEYQIYAPGLSGSATADWNIELFRETTASYSATDALLTGLAAASVRDLFLALPLVRLVRADQWVDFSLSGRTAANTWANRVSGQRVLNMGTAQKITRVRLAQSTGNWDAGQMFLYRRRLII